MTDTIPVPRDGSFTVEMMHAGFNAAVAAQRVIRERGQTDAEIILMAMLAACYAAMIGAAGDTA